MKKLKVTLDMRENSLIKKMSKMDDFDILIEKLEVGDITISNIGIERKAGLDFVTSIKDGRLFKQLIHLSDAYEHPILIIEDMIYDENITGLSMRQIMGAFAFISSKIGVSIIPTRSLEDTIIILERFAYRKQIKDVDPSLRANTNTSISFRMTYFLQGLIDTGPEKAKVLVEVFKTPNKVFDAINNTEIIYTKNGKPKGIKGPLAELKGFGYKYIQKNKMLLTNMS